MASADLDEKLQEKVDDAKIEGWTVGEQQGERVVMEKRSYGSLKAHLLIALLTVWWTVGLGNVAYAAYVYFTKADRRVLRPE